MTTSWVFTFRNLRIEISPNMVQHRSDEYTIYVNGIATQKNISLKKVVSWCANAMMNSK